MKALRAKRSEFCSVALDVLPASSVLKILRTSHLHGRRDARPRADRSNGTPTQFKRLSNFPVGAIAFGAAGDASATDRVQVGAVRQLLVRRATIHSCGTQWRLRCVGWKEALNHRGTESIQECVYTYLDLLWTTSIRNHCGVRRISGNLWGRGAARDCGAAAQKAI